MRTFSVSNAPSASRARPSTSRKWRPRFASSNRQGHTYRSDGSVYFRISTFPGYGKLSHNDFDGMVAGARVDVDSYEKTDARDFALWKAPKPGEPSWDTEIGTGRPGWHIECSVMAIEFLGATLDIHAGGVDLIFPHHENEIAQSEALTGKPFANYWLHSEFLLVDGQKMSKSLGNFYTLRDLCEKLGIRPESIRYLLASVPYRKGLNFTMDGLKSAATAIDRLRNFKLRLESAKFGDGINPRLRRRRRECHESIPRRSRRRSQHRRSARGDLRIRPRSQHRDGPGRIPFREPRPRARGPRKISIPFSTC